MWLLGGCYAVTMATAQGSSLFLATNIDAIIACKINALSISFERGYFIYRSFQEFIHVRVFDLEFQNLVSFFFCVLYAHLLDFAHPSFIQKFSDNLRKNIGWILKYDEETTQREMGMKIDLQ